MPAPALSLRRKLLYAAVLSSLAALLGFAALELGLRVLGFGASPHFAERARLASGETVWRDNRDCTAPFFSPALARRPQPFLLPAAKAPGTIRVFVLGSSAAMGDPEPSFSLSRHLELQLRSAYPETQFEVVNAGLTAINSHLLRGFAADCAALAADLFVVYEGNNEVIGPFGPTGVFAPFLRSAAAVRTLVWLQGTRTGQLLAAAGRAATGRLDAPSGWGGMAMFLRQQIPADDPRLAAVRAHFRANLTALAASARSAGASTLLCTVVTNRRDFAPFLSAHRPGLAPADLARWQTAFDAGIRAESAGNLAAAEAVWRDALALDDRHADLVFRLGRLALRAGRDAEARDLLSRAQDLDVLRFRTDSALNAVIRDLRAPDTTVVDLAAALAARSQHGLPGDDLLYEHVHLNFRGTYEAACALLPAVHATLVRRGQLPASTPLPAPLEYDAVRLRLGYSAHEQAMIALRLLDRFRAPPFPAQSDHAARLALWEKRAETAQRLLTRPETLPALRSVYEQALALWPSDWILARNTGAMLVARGAPADALPYLERASAAIDARDVDTLVALGHAHRALGHAAAASAAFARARTLEPRYPGLPEL